MVEKSLIGKDPHLSDGCSSCHKGDSKLKTQEGAHKGLVKRPSDNPSLCGACHDKIAGAYRSALHYTSLGQKHGVSRRFSDAGRKIFDEKVFEQSCRSCHASCGDCHVRGPSVSGVSVGLVKGHKFFRKDEGKTCASCHGGRVYPEFTGEYGGTADVHYEKGMMCVDCHTGAEMHGDGHAYKSRSEPPMRPRCMNCHKPGQEKSEKARTAHATHKDKATCQGCHSAAQYRNCYSCHLGKGATSKAEFILGRDPRDKGKLTTLRSVPVVRDTFASAGIKMDHFDQFPTYWGTVPHNIRKRTERTRSCETCHRDRKDFITAGKPGPDGSKANDALQYVIKPVQK